MKRTMTKLALCAMALLFAHTAFADVKTYDFVRAASGSIELPTWGEEVVVHGDITLNLLAYGTTTFDNRFAVGPTTRNNDSGNCFKFRTASVDYRGLWSQYGDRNFSILNLKAGDKVTITICKNETTLKFIDGDAVVSGQEYTVEADGTLDFVSTGSVYIEKVTIETQEKGVPVTIGIIPDVDPAVYDFVVAEEGSTLAPTYGETVSTGGANLQLFSGGGNAFDNKFAIGPTNRNNGNDGGFIFRTAGNWKGLWSKYGDRRFSILNLKQGETVALTISNNDPNLKFVGGDVIVSNQEYVVEADGNLDFVTTGGVYIEKVSITPANVTGTSTGITLVSATALDFTNASIKAYIATAANAGTVTFKQVYKVPANTPLLLKADNTTPLTVRIDELEGAAEDVSGNLLKGSATESTALTSEGETKYYVYGTHSKKAAFYYASELTSQAGKAYLALTTEQAGAASFINAIFDENVTGIETVKTTMGRTSNEMYTLGGQRVSKATMKGVYVVNGRKVVIK